jgi:WD40 repeat protein
MLATVSEDATCKIWPGVEGIANDGSKVLETLKGHQGKNVRALASHDGFVATGGDDGAIKVWNVKEILQNKTS